MLKTIKVPKFKKTKKILIKLNKFFYKIKYHLAVREAPPDLTAKSNHLENPVKKMKML